LHLHRPLSLAKLILPTHTLASLRASHSLCKSPSSTLAFPSLGLITLSALSLSLSHSHTPLALLLHPAGPDIFVACEQTSISGKPSLPRPLTTRTVTTTTTTTTTATTHLTAATLLSPPLALSPRWRLDRSSRNSHFIWPNSRSHPETSHSSGRPAEAGARHNIHSWGPSSSG
jgi:hypothetical protein